MAATPVNITSLSRAANVVTVGYSTPFVPALVVGQAIWLQGVTTDPTFQGIYVIATVPTTTSLTFNQTAPGATPAASGTVTPAKNFVVLVNSTSVGGEVDVNVEFWYPVPTGSELSTGNSSFSRIASDETNAIVAGRLAIEQKQIPFPDTYSAANMELFLQAMYASKLAYRNGKLLPGAYYGFFFDGVGWARG